MWWRGGGRRFATLAALFNGGPNPPGPNNCDLDPTDDFLGCGSYDGC